MAELALISALICQGGQKARRNSDYETSTDTRARNPKKRACVLA